MAYVGDATDGVAILDPPDLLSKGRAKGAQLKLPRQLYDQDETMSTEDTNDENIFMRYL